jgi:hypothetical protein
MTSGRRSQDQPKTKIRIARRREKLTKMFAEGASVSKAHELLKDEGIVCSRATVGFDLQAIRGDFADRLPEAREEAYDELKQLKQLIAKAEGMKLGEKIDKHLAVHDRLARLLGLDAPSKSVKVSVDGGSPEQLIGYRRFVAETQGLSSDDLERVYEFAKSIRRPRTLNAAIAVLEESEGGNELV